MFSHRSSRILFLAVVAPFFILSCTQRANVGAAITEDGEKVKINGVTLAYMPKGTFKLAPDEGISKIEAAILHDVNGDGQWIKMSGPLVCVAPDGKWLYVKGAVSPFIAGRKYRSEVQLKYFKRNAPKTILTVTTTRDFVY